MALFACKRDTPRGILPVSYTHLKEVNEFDAEKVVGWYSKTKAMATQAVLDAVKKEGLNACVAVSYTHLDVYKRQLLLFLRPA